MEFDKLIRVLTGMVVGAIYGYILASSLFSLEDYIWIVASLAGAVVGAVVGSSSFFDLMLGASVGSTIGLYLGWIIASIIFGDHLGGIGAGIAMSGAFVGWSFGTRDVFNRSSRAISSLIASLHGGFLMGILFLVMDAMTLGNDFHYPIVSAPYIIASGAVFGLIGYVLANR